MANTQVTVRDEGNVLSIFSNAQSWELATRMAASLAKSTIVPKEFQNNANNALIAIELANRLQTSPLMVMQNLYVVYGRPSWSAQYIIGMINNSGKYDMELQYDEVADKNGKPFSCRCWTEKDGRRVNGPVIDMDMAKAEGWLGKNGSKWQTMPQIMLRYRAASFFGRMNCPELTMGIYTREEVVELGPDEYTVSDMEAKVRQDIVENANSVDFVPAKEKQTPKTAGGAGKAKPKDAVAPENELVEAKQAGPEEELPDFMKG